MGLANAGGRKAVMAGPAPRAPEGMDLKVSASVGVQHPRRECLESGYEWEQPVLCHFVQETFIVEQEKLLSSAAKNQACCELNYPL